MSTVRKLVGAVLVTLVTDWSLPTLRVLQKVTAPPDLVEHHGTPLSVIGAEKMLCTGVAVEAVPVIPAGSENCSPSDLDLKSFHSNMRCV